MMNNGISTVFQPARFMPAFNRTLRFEDSVPPGRVQVDNNGADVCRGINQASYPEYFSLSNPLRLTLAGAVQIYEAIWDGDHIPLLADVIQDTANQVFDMAFNAGPSWGPRCLQEACNALGCTLTVDGNLGPLTAAAANAQDPVKLLAAVREARIERYESIEARNIALKPWLPVWIDRVNAA